MAIVSIIGGALWLSLGPTQLSLGGGTPVFSARPTLGEAVYNASCLSCHGGPTGGEMMDYPPRHNANGHTWHHSDCDLVNIVREGSNAMTDAMRAMMARPGAPRMQAFKDRLSPEEIDAVLAFIKTMWTAEERAAQALVTQDECKSAGTKLVPTNLSPAVAFMVERVADVAPDR